MAKLAKISTYTICKLTPVCIILRRVSMCCGPHFEIRKGCDQEVILREGKTVLKVLYM